MIRLHLKSDLFPVTDIYKLLVLFEGGVVSVFRRTGQRG